MDSIPCYQQICGGVFVLLESRVMSATIPEIRLLEYVFSNLCQKIILTFFTF